MELIPAISTGAEKLAPQVFRIGNTTPERLAELRAIPYEAYLTTPEWRRRRDRALVLASWQCQRRGCLSKRQLQVHHRTYERLGIELDDDLVVLCDPCHRREHLEALESSARGIHLKLVREALRMNAFGTIADLSEDAKRLCAAHGVPYNGPEIHHAIGLLTGARMVRVTPAIVRSRVYVPFGLEAAVHAQAAHEILSGLDRDGVRGTDVVKAMPDGFLPCEGSVLAQMRAIRAEEARTQHELSWSDQLTDIFDMRPRQEDEIERITRERAEIDEWIRHHSGLNYQ
jgi:hypothetical protein